MHKEEWWGKVGVDWLMRELVLKVFICWFWFENTVYKRRKRKKRKKNNVMKWGGKGEWGCIGMSCLTALLCIRCSSELSAFLSSTHTPSHLFTSTFTFGSLVNFPLGERERERERESFYLSTSKQPLDWLFLLVKIFLPY